MTRGAAFATLSILAGSMAPTPAQAFNTYNGTPFPICVLEATSKIFGGYGEVVAPRTTSKGWYLNSSIRLCVFAFNGTGNDGVTVCNEAATTCMDVPPHQQQLVSQALFVDGGQKVGGDGTPVQWTLWGAGYPAGFDMTLD